MTWLDTVSSDPLVGEDARALARIMVEGFSTGASGYVSGHDAQFAEMLGVSIRTVAEARKQLTAHGHLIPLAGRMNAPSFRLSSCRW